MPSMESLYEKEIVCKANCAVCGKESSMVQLHHVSYKHLGDEQPSDLVVLCPECHKRVHENKDFLNFIKKHKGLYSGQETAEQRKKRKAKNKKRNERKKRKKMYHYATCPNSCRVRKVC